MIKKLITGITAVFIDASNIYHSQKGNISIELVREAKYVDIKRLKNNIELTEK